MTKTYTFLFNTEFCSRKRTCDEVDRQQVCEDADLKCSAEEKGDEEIVMVLKTEDDFKKFYIGNQMLLSTVTEDSNVSSSLLPI
jgi:hypothetical protein